MSVSLRRIATAASTMVVAIALALIVPTAQLHTVSDQATCCCPDPQKCKCHDHDGASGHSSMRACHKQTPELVKFELSAFVAPAVVAVAAPARPAMAALAIVTQPHASPPPRRPDAPS